jgi:hypothetical protein
LESPEKGYGLLAAFFKHGDEHPASTKGGQFLD